MADNSAEVPLHQYTQQGQKLEELEATVLLESYNLTIGWKLSGTNPMTGT